MNVIYIMAYHRLQYFKHSPLNTGGCLALPLASCKLVLKLLHLLIMTEGKTLPNRWHLVVAETHLERGHWPATLIGTWRGLFSCQERVFSPWLLHKC